MKGWGHRCKREWRYIWADVCPECGKERPHGDVEERGKSDMPKVRRRKKRPHREDGAWLRRHCAVCHSSKTPQECPAVVNRCARAGIEWCAEGDAGVISFASEGLGNRWEPRGGEAQGFYWVVCLRFPRIPSVIPRLQPVLVIRHAAHIARLAVAAWVFLLIVL